MTLTLAQVIGSVRNRHPAFDSSRVPDPVLASVLSDAQNQLIGKAVAREKTFLSQSVSIALALDAANSPDVVGAGSSGGLPGAVSSAGALSAVSEEAGFLPEPALAAPTMAERAVTSATTTTTTSTGAGRTINADANLLLVVTRGTGRGQIRQVVSNTATQWTHAAWQTIPDVTSLVALYPATLVASTLGVVTASPTESTRRGYLVRLSSAGVPTIDYTQPLIMSIDRGVPLPSALAVIGGTVRFSDGTPTEALCITSYGRRYDPPEFPAIYMVGDTVNLCPDIDGWAGVSSIELRYTPIAPDFVALSDLFLVPDAAKPALVAQGAAFAAERIAGIGEKVDVSVFAARAGAAENDYLQTLRLSKRGRQTTMREGVY